MAVEWSITNDTYPNYLKSTLLSGWMSTKEHGAGAGEISKQNELPHADSSANMHAEGSHRRRIYDAAWTEATVQEANEASAPLFERPCIEATEHLGDKGGGQKVGRKWEKGDVMKGESNQPFDAVKGCSCIKMIVTKRSLNDLFLAWCRGYQRSAPKMQDVQPKIKMSQDTELKTKDALRKTKI
ncbi:hypothetical protein B0H13DRAFT_1865544 [Mycena leptocephala]|nr:hypothetical protein B0H13DRAFT_1865544 [Mycena leptocephala]